MPAVSAKYVYVYFTSITEEAVTQNAVEEYRTREKYLKTIHLSESGGSISCLQ
jgi:hypothetical protein